MQNKSSYKKLILPLTLFCAFIVFTLCVKNIDVKQTGVLDSVIGFATINLTLHNLIGINPLFDKVSDLFLATAFLVAFSFAVFGFVQLCKRNLDKKILVLGIFYFVVILFYFFFEKVIINYRPILENGTLEASYPSSHVLITIFILESAISVIKNYITNKKFYSTLKILFRIMIFVTVILRFLSGVHWFTDIIGAALLSVSLIEFFKFVERGY